MKVARSEIFPANPDILEGVDDLIQLSYLNEPSVLHNLQFRFSQDIIYVCVLLWLDFLLVLSSICSHMPLVPSVYRVRQDLF